MARIFELQDAFDSASTDAERENIRKEIHDLGFQGVAASIGHTSEDQDRLARQVATSPDSHA